MQKKKTINLKKQGQKSKTRVPFSMVLIVEKTQYHGKVRLCAYFGWDMTGSLNFILLITDEYKI